MTADSMVDAPTGNLARAVVRWRVAAIAIGAPVALLLTLTGNLPAWAALAVVAALCAAFLVGARGVALVAASPFVWLLVFFLLPFAIVAMISLSVARIGIPPYEPLWRSAEEAFTLTLNFQSFLFLIEDPVYVDAYLSSLEIAAISTVAALLIGYPMALGVARARGARRLALLMMVALPFWTSFLIRVYAWKLLLQNDGLIGGPVAALSSVLLSWGVIDAPFSLLNSKAAVYIGIVYTYLPFMVLPLFANLERHDPALLEAAQDLGARPSRAFLSVTLPLSTPGIIAGSLLVFIPAVGEYVVPELLGGTGTLMIGRVLWDEFARNLDWPLASAVACAMLFLLVIPIMLFQRAQARDSEGAAA